MTNVATEQTPPPAVQIANSIAIKSLKTSPTNPRKHYDETALNELAESVKANGVIQALLVRPAFGGGGYEIVAGERRYRAAKIAKLDSVPCLIRDLNDQQVLELQVIENLQREGLHPLEEADGYARLRKEYKFSAEDIMAKIHKSRGYVFNRLKLLDLCPEARKAFYDGTLSASVADLIARIGHHDTQRAALKDVIKGRHNSGPMSFREAREFIHREYMLKLADAPFDTKADNLIAKVGPCAACPKRTGNQPELFADISSKDVCTDPKCFKDKTAAQAAIKLKEATAAGQTVIAGKAAEKIFPYDHNRESVDQQHYVRADQKCYTDTKMRTYGQLAGADNPALQIVQHPDDGTLIKVISVADAKKILKAAGIGKRPKPAATSKQKAAAERAADHDDAIQAALFHAVRAKLATKAQDRNDWIMLATEMYEHIISDAAEDVLKLWNIDRTKPAHPNIAKLDARDLFRFCIDCILIEDFEESNERGKQPTKIIELAKRLRIDVAQFRRDKLAEIKKATDKAATPKPAAKKKSAAAPAKKTTKPAKKKAAKK